MVDEAPDWTKRHLFLAVLGWRVSPYHAQSMTALALMAAQRGLRLTVHQDLTTGVDRARNISVELARMTECTDLMFVDADLSFDPEDIFTMLQARFSVVGGAYPKKGVNMERVAAAVREGYEGRDLEERACDHVVNARPGAAKCHVSPGGARFLEVEELGTGFLMFRRAALERYIARWKHEIEYVTDYEPRGVVHHMVFACQRDPDCERERATRALHALAICMAAAATDAAKVKLLTPLCDAAEAFTRAILDPETLGRYLTEDYAFCRRMRMMGESVVCFLEARLAHQGPTFFRGHLAHDFTGPVKPARLRVPLKVCRPRRDRLSKGKAAE